jgi:predicted amidohydrolase
MYAPLVKNGAQILLVPSAFTVPTGAAHWHTLLQGKSNISNLSCVFMCVCVKRLVFCTHKFSKYVFSPPVLARAIENQCYVLAAAQFGQHNEKRQSFGHSLAVDPWGEILCDAGGYPYDGLDDSAKAAVSEERTKDPPTVVTCTIDLEAIDSIRQRMPLEQHRKSATFSFLE